MGLDALPTVDLDVMSVSLRGIGDEPLVYYTDPMKLLTHLNEVHGAEAVNGMAGLMAWSQAPARALGRFDAGRPPKTLDEMYACATNEFERSTITDMLFGSVSDVLDRYLPDKEKHGALRGMLAFLAVNTTYRGPETPGTAAAFAFGLAVPNEDAVLTKKLRGGIGALTQHLIALFTADGGRPAAAHPGRPRSLSATGGPQVCAPRTATTISAPIVVSAVAPDFTLTRLIDPNAVPAGVRERFSRTDHRGSYLQMHFALDGIPEFAAPYELLNDPAMQANIGLFATPEELQQQWEDCRRGIVPADPAVALQIPSVHDPQLAPEGKHAASAFSLWFPIEGDGLKKDGAYGAIESRNGTTGDRQAHPHRPEFRAAHHTAHHVHAPAHGHHVRRSGRRLLLRPAAPRPDRHQPPWADGLRRPADRSRRALPGQRRMPWRARHHVHPRLQRGSRGPRTLNHYRERAAESACGHRLKE